MEYCVSILFLLKRNHYDETCSFGVVRIDPDAAFQDVGYNGLADGKAQSGTLLELIQLGETFEYRLLFVQRDTNSRIGDGESQLISVSFQLEGDASLFSELGRIVQQVDDHLLDVTRINVAPQLLYVAFEAQLHLLFIRPGIFQRTEQ